MAATTSTRTQHAAGVRGAAAITPAQIRAIKFSQRHLGIDDPTYRLMLAGYSIEIDPDRAGTPAMSCKDLSIRQAAELITRLQLAGSPIGRPHTGRSRAEGIITLATPAQRSLIARLRQEITWRLDDGYQRWLSNRMGLETVRTFQEAARVIEGLKGMSHRRA